jgi:hypothetical protein
MSSDRSLNKLSDLLFRQLSDGLNDEEHTHLKDWLADDAEARQYYVEFTALNAQLRKQRVASLAPEFLDIDLGEANPSDIEAFAGWFEETGQDEAQTSEPNAEHVNEIRRIAEQRLQAFLAEQEQVRRQQAMVPAWPV